MREISCNEITATIKKLFIDSNYFLPDDLTECIKCSKQCEKNELAKEVLGDILENLNASKELNVPICQDTGMAIVFIEVGQEVHITDGLLNDAINSGVSQAYIDGNLRCSVVEDPILRKNTNNNTPAIIHTKIVEGDKIKITAVPKGFGSENMSKIKMFTPSATVEDIIDFVVSVVTIADSNPCPPIVVGIGIGGDFEYSAVLSKIALARSTSIRNSNGFYADLENKILTKINETNIGPQGFGGNTTALCVNIEQFPTHIAGLPVAVNIGCHVTRHLSTEI